MPEHEEKFTPRVSKALDLALQATLRFQHREAGPEHILLGILREGTGVGSGVLTNLGVEVVDLREAIEGRMTPGADVVRGEVRYSSEAEALFDKAAQEATELRCNYIGQEHLLLAMLRDNGNAAAKILHGFGVKYDDTRKAVIEALFFPGDGKPKVKRYNLALPEDLFAEVERLAEREHMTVLEVLRRSVKLGLFVDRVQQNPDSSIIIREGGAERQLVLL